MALGCAIHSPPSALASDDARQIRALIGATWDKPDSPVETDPVVVSGDHAVASWAQGAHGGRALLRRGARGWRVVLCSGDPLREAGRLVEAGVPGADAARIAADLKAAEAQVPETRRAMFSLFEGVVTGDGTEPDAPAGHAPHAHHETSIRSEPLP